MNHQGIRRYRNGVTFFLSLSLLLTVSRVSAFEPGGEVPSPAAAEWIKQSLKIPMSDGTKLNTTVLLPQATGKFPVILVRTPYNREAEIDRIGALPSHGYALVSQSPRGSGGSEGVRRVFEADGWSNGKRDGYDMVEWIAQQPWCNGKVATWGYSASGINEYLVAGSAPPHLTCQYVAFAAPSGYEHAVYPGGTFRRSLIKDWQWFVGFDQAQFDDWILHSKKDAYWDTLDLSTRWERVNVPAIHIAGWYDIFLQGTLDAYEGYQNKGGRGASGRQKLIVGPWDHPFGTRPFAVPRAGSAVLPPIAGEMPGRFKDPWPWFDFWMKGTDNKIDQEPSVMYYVMGAFFESNAPGHVWRTASSWPVPSAPTPYYFRSDQKLTLEKPNEQSAFKEFTYDPDRAVPTTGGNHLFLTSGPVDQKDVENRPDVVVFTGPVLEEPLEVTGRVRVRLWISSDATDTDYTAKLCDVAPDGRSFNICDGILRVRFRDSLREPKLMTPGQIYPVEIDLWSTSMIFNRGHRLRVQISSSNRPAYDPNPNTGAPFQLSPIVRRATDPPAFVAQNRIYIDADHPSHIILPVVVPGSGGTPLAGSPPPSIRTR